MAHSRTDLESLCSRIMLLDVDVQPAIGGHCIALNLGARKALSMMEVSTRIEIGGFILATSKRPQDTLLFGTQHGDRVRARFDEREAAMERPGFFGHLWLVHDPTESVIDFAWATYPGAVRRSPDWEWALERSPRVLVGPHRSNEKRIDQWNPGDYAYHPEALGTQARMLAKIAKDDALGALVNGC